MGIKLNLANPKVTGVQKEHHKQFLWLWMIGVFTYMGSGLVYPQLSTRIINQGISLKDFGTMQAVATLLSISSQVYIGILSDRIGRRKPLLVGALLLQIPMVIAFPHAAGIIAFTFLLSANQMATSLFNATTANWVTRFGSDDQIGRLHGFYRISFSVGWVVATLFIGTSLDYLGFNGTFYVAAILLALSLLVTIFATRDPEQDLRQPQANATDLGAPSSPYKLPAGLKWLLGALGIFVLAQTMGMNLNYIFFMDEMKVTNQQFGLLTSIQSWPEIPMMLLLGIMSDKVDSTLLLAAGMALAGLRWLFMALVGSFGSLLAVQPLHAIGMTVTEVVMVANIARLTPRDHLGLVMGWQVTVTNFARFLAPLIAGGLGHYFGIRTVFAISALVAGAAAMVVFRMARTPSSLGHRS